MPHNIKSIQFFNHKIFGNQSFDFTIDGTIAKNIIIAGENGSGKTKLLEELHNISTASYYIGTSVFSRIIYEAIIDVSQDNFINADDNEKIEEVKLIASENENGAKSYCIRFIKGAEELLPPHIIDFRYDTPFKINGLFSTVDINYKPINNVQGITDKKLDDDNANMLPNDIAYETIQLLVDIATQDSNDFVRWYESHKGEIPDEEMYNRRLKRFTNAFDKMFGGTIKYNGIKDNTIPMFTKNNKDIDVYSLSSGEKQIIFRGIHLLRNKESLKGAPVFIDEPEISMHPKWEDNIFNYYTTLFSDGTNQTSQIFFATHSEHVISSALNDDNSLIIKMEKGTYKPFYKGSSGLVLPTITISEIKYAIFDMYTTDYHIQLYGYIQKNLVRKACGTRNNDPNITQTDTWLKSKAVTPKNYYKKATSLVPDYYTLQTYIRNCIDHPDPNITYTPEELRTSIDEMIYLINNP